MRIANVGIKPVRKDIIMDLGPFHFSVVFYNTEAPRPLLAGGKWYVCLVTSTFNSMFEIGGRDAV